MDATQLKAYRDKLRATENNIAIRLYCDNGIIIDEGSMFVKWDDANNVIMAIKSNEDQQNHPGVKMKIIVTDFDMVQYMIAYSTHKSVQPIAKVFGFTDDQIKNFINKFDNAEFFPDKNKVLDEYYNANNIDERLYFAASDNHYIEVLLREQ